MKKLIGIGLLVLLGALFIQALLADGVLQNVSGTTQEGGAIAISGSSATGLLSITNSADPSTNVFFTRATETIGIRAASSGNRGLFLVGANSLWVATTSVGNADGGLGMDSTGVRLRSSFGIRWSSGTDPSTGIDTGVYRNAGAIVEVNNGTAGTYGQMLSKGFLMPTNYVAANFTPVSGMVLIVASNGVLYKVTQLSTNLLSANTP